MLLWEEPHQCNEGVKWIIFQLLLLHLQTLVLLHQHLQILVLPIFDCLLLQDSDGIIVLLHETVAMIVSMDSNEQVVSLLQHHLVIRIQHFQILEHSLLDPHHRLVKHGTIVLLQEIVPMRVVMDILEITVSRPL